jgi:hypothetical protein
MIKVKTSKQIKKDDAPDNMLWMDLFGYIRYLEFHLEEIKRIPFNKRNDDLKYQMKHLRKEIAYLNAWFKGDLK